MITRYESICAICGRPATDVHHLVFGRGLRDLATEDDLLIPLCRECHQHIHNDGVSGTLSKIAGQLEFEKSGTREDFLKRYGRSYL